MKTNSTNVSIVIVLLYMLLGMSFVGNGSIQDIPVYLVIMPICFYFSLSIGKITNYSHRFYILASLLLVLQIQNIVENYELKEYYLGHSEYIYWPLQAFACMLLAAGITKRHKITISSLFLTISLVFLLSAVTYSLLVLSTDRNNTFLFGPNVYYRILGILSIFLVFSFRNINIRRKLKLFFVLITLLVFVVVALQTGSRGSIPTVIIVLLGALHIMFPNNIKSSFVTTFLIAAGVYLILDYSGITNTSRVFLFDTTSIGYETSAGLRIAAWQIWLSEPMKHIASFGMSPEVYERDYGLLRMNYPHNFLLELLLYYGGIGFFISLVWLLVFYKSSLVSMRSNNSIYLLLTYVTAIFAIGSFFSGDYRDNYATVGVLFGLYSCQVSLNDHT